MTLQEAVDIALARNTGFRGTVSSLLTSRAGLDIARQALGPEPHWQRDAEPGFRPLHHPGSGPQLRAPLRG